MANEGHPSLERFQTAYAKRRPFRASVQYPPDVPDVAGAIDVHCHAHEGQQDALALAKHASRARMGGLLYKTLPARTRPAERVAAIRDELARWAEAEGVEPIACWAGFTTDKWNGGPSRATVEPQLQAGVRAIWMPTASHANSMHITGGWRRYVDPGAATNDLLPPMPLDEAIRLSGMYFVQGGKLDPNVADVVRLCQDYDAALFFGHVTPEEQDALAEEVDRLGYKKAVIDHPFSLYVNLSLARMQQFARAGIFLNFTYDELSPLMGVDPAAMAAAIRTVGPEHCTLSSDAGEPLFPNSVEAMRLIMSYMRAYGLSAAAIEQMTVTNPRYLLGVS